MSNLAAIVKKSVENRNQKSNNSDKPKAEFWLNIGYVTEDENGEEVFISTPIGLPVDTQTASDKSPFASEQQDLINQLIQHGQGLDSGESIDINPEVLTLRLQRVSDRTHKSKIVKKQLSL